jgi:hypothetical protein
MARNSDPLAGFQPSIQTVELLCERLGELGHPIGADTARELLRAVFAKEAPRLDARIRDALNTSLETIRTAAQSAIGVLGATAAVTPPPRALSPAEITPHARAVRKTPAGGIARVGQSSGSRRKVEEPVDDAPSRGAQTSRGKDELDQGGRRPIFRRPRDR